MGQRYRHWVQISKEIKNQLNFCRLSKSFYFSEFLFAIKIKNSIQSNQSIAQTLKLENIQIV